MFKCFTALMLIFMMITANFTRLFIYAGYEVNQKYIAEKLCENRDKPWLNCNGRCYLMKKIKQAEDKERSAERQVQKSLFQDVFFATNFSFKFHQQLLRLITERYQTMQPQQVCQSILRPPRVA
jgi:predicted NACHT family NTPase